MPIKVGDIVTVVLECSYHKFQGEVIAIVHDGDEDGSIEVLFRKEYKDRGHCWFGEDTDQVRFEESDLRVDQGWSTSTLASRIYGQLGWHCCHEPSHPFDLGGECMIADCPYEATVRGICNVLGTVYPLDLCSDCSRKYHGKCGEILPDLKPAKGAVPA